MNSDLSVLRDPDGGGPLTPDRHALFCGKASYPIINGIPRFVDNENYAFDFGLQWIRFAKTQLDSFTDLDVTEKRLERCLRGRLADIRGRLVLEAGSGAGRFTEILLKHGAVLHSFDFSNAVEANGKNNGASDKLTLVQADIRRMPFPKHNYDGVICLGVLQHTPDPEESITRLYEMVRPGGFFAFDHYLFKWRNILPPPIGSAETVVRRIVLALPQRRRLEFINRIVAFWFPIHWKYRHSIAMQRVLRRLSPVHFYYSRQGLTDKQLCFDWALLDTHDGTTDYYKHHRTVKQITRHLATLGATQIAAVEAGNGVEAFCVKPEGAE